MERTTHHIEARKRLPRTWPLFLILTPLLLQCSPEKKEMEVTATAYNSLPYQTRPNSNGNVAAWGDTLREGMKCIAVSRDLLDSGLTHGKKVWIEGLDGPFIVLDKMHYRWRNKIDIYLGKDVDKAKKWGRKKVTISFVPPEEDTEEVP